MPSSCHLNHGQAIWFTGMPGSGKTTVAIALHALLDEKNVPTVMLDGDLIRPIICEGLGHTAEDRWKSLEKYTQLTTQIINSRVISILAVINHAEKQRAFARKAHPEGRFLGVWINTPVEVCQSRDPNEPTKPTKPASLGQALWSNQIFAECWRGWRQRW